MCGKGFSEDIYIHIHGLAGGVHLGLDECLIGIGLSKHQSTVLEELVHHSDKPRRQFIINSPSLGLGFIFIDSSEL